ncbi:MAG: GNAT family N-acetyltransferase [Geminicoccaceae bacterium]
MKDSYSRCGLLNTIYDAFYRSINCVCIFQNLKGMIATEESLTKVELPSDSGLTIKFLSNEELLDHSKDPSNELTSEFLEKAFQKQDHGLAILDDNKIASYGWYSNKPTRIFNNIDLFFSSDWMYMHKGLTKPEYRGMRLHAVGMCHATSYFAEQGFKGLISYVESNNFASMKSVTRMGYEIFGSVFITSLFDKFATWSSSGCMDYQFHACAQRT